MRSQKKLLEQEEQKESGVDTPDTALNLREPETRARPAKDSVDDQIDALILRYETSSIREKASVNESLSKLNLRFLLEQEEEQAGEEETGDDAPGAAAAAGEEAQEPTKDEEPSGSDDMQVTEPAEEQEVPDLDVDKFTMRVVRLVNNYQNLLRTEEAIINRAKTFLDENYGEVFVSEFLNSLSQKYGLEVNEFDDIPDVPSDIYAVGAFAGGTGGLGGGGGG
jgi:hypothetical protein